MFIGCKVIEFFIGLGYEVKMLEYFESGCVVIFKGFLLKVKKLVIVNVECFVLFIFEYLLLVGLEFFVILIFRDEYL